MKTATLKEIRTELGHCSHEELLNICFRLIKFKKENKELISYILFESHDEEGYINSVNELVNNYFDNINTSNFHYIKKSIRKTLRELKKYIRYSQNKETEVELLIHFCQKLKEFKPSIARNKTLTNLYQRQLGYLQKKVNSLHEDLQFDYRQQLDLHKEIR